MKYKFAVLGNPIEHSKSPEIHLDFAHQFDLAIEYQKILVPLNEFPQYAIQFLLGNGYGANVTIPFKEQAYQLCSKHSQRAIKARSVNTLIKLNDNQWQGDNTDGVGLVNDILANQISLKNKNILILGAGGAVRGIIHPLQLQQVKSIYISNRTMSKAILLAKEFDVNCIELASAQLNNYEIIINATSSGLTQQSLAINNSLFEHCELAYDMVYCQDGTPFLNLAKQHNVALCKDGLGMLVYQAAESFFQWTGLRPDCKPVIEKLQQ